MDQEEMRRIAKEEAATEVSYMALFMLAVIFAVMTLAAVAYHDHMALVKAGLVPEIKWREGIK